MELGVFGKLEATRCWKPQEFGMGNGLMDRGFAFVMTEEWYRARKPLCIPGGYCLLSVMKTGKRI